MFRRLPARLSLTSIGGMKLEHTCFQLTFVAHVQVGYLLIGNCACGLSLCEMNNALMLLNFTLPKKRQRIFVQLDLVADFKKTNTYY